MSKKQIAAAGTLSGREKTAYYAGMGGQNIIYAIIGTACIGYYWANVIFLPAIAIGVISVVARIWDAINDPMMGTVVDRTRSKWGKCRPYLIFMPIIIGIVTILCFVNGRYGSQNSATENMFIIMWAAVSYILWGMLYTVGDIPIWSMPALMTGNEKERSTLLALARVTAGIGGALGMVAIPLAQAIAGPGADPAQVQKGFIIVAVVMTILGTALFQMTGIMCKERVVQSEERHTLKENFKLMWTNKPYRRLMISGVIRSPFQLLLLVAMPLLSYYFANNQSPFSDYRIILAYVLLAGGIFGGMFVASAIAPKLGEKFEKRRVYNAFSIASGVSFALIFVVFLIAPTALNNVWFLLLLFLAFLLCGAGMGAVQVMQSLMIADCIDYEEYHNSIRPDGVFFSGQSFITKISSGVASLIMAISYTIVGFSDVNIESLNIGLSDGMIDFKVDTPVYAWVMFFLVAVPASIGMILSILPMLKYEISDKWHREMLDEINIRRELAVSSTIQLDEIDITNNMIESVSDESMISTDAALTENADNINKDNEIIQQALQVDDKEIKANKKPKKASKAKTDIQKDEKAADDKPVADDSTDKGEKL